MSATPAALGSSLPLAAAAEPATVPAPDKPRHSLLWTTLTILIAVILLFPVIWLASMAFKPDELMFARPTVWTFIPTFDHFDYVLAAGFLKYLGSSVLLALVSTAMVVVIGTPAAYAFARFELKARDDLFLFILGTRMAPPICLVIPFYLIFTQLELLDTFLGLSLAYLTFNLSFYVWVLRSFCRDLPVELEEAAMVEGWSRFSVFLRVVLPLLKSGIVSTAMLCFIFAWTEFLFAFMLGGNNVKTLPVAIPLLITSQGVRWGEMAVVGMVALLPVLVAVFLLQKQIVRGLTMGAVKG
jgi:multiple sugar transport system permease protein